MATTATEGAMKQTRLRWLHSPSRLAVGSTVIGVVIALFWLNAPVVPALIGGLGAGLLLCRRGTVTN